MLTPGVTTIACGAVAIALHLERERGLSTMQLSGRQQTNKQQTPWPESGSELYRPSDRRLSAK
jgi:hypothetical protein